MLHEALGRGGTRGKHADFEGFGEATIWGDPGAAGSLGEVLELRGSGKLKRLEVHGRPACGTSGTWRSPDLGSGDRTEAFHGRSGIDPHSFASFELLLPQTNIPDAMSQILDVGSWSVFEVLVGLLESHTHTHTLDMLFRDQFDLDEASLAPRKTLSSPKSRMCFGFQGALGPGPNVRHFRII